MSEGYAGVLIADMEHPTGLLNKCVGVKKTAVSDNVDGKILNIIFVYRNVCPMISAPSHRDDD